MGHGISIERIYDDAERAQLLALARAAIAAGIAGERLDVERESLAPALTVRRASFVTLYLHGRLRGCMGTLEARRTLAEDVAEMAYAAAFRDPRFPRLDAPEFDATELHVAVLGTPEPLAFASEEDLLRQLRPGIDGVVFYDRLRRATFLPSVWEMLAEPREFLGRLKEKAGLPRDHWSDSVRVERYTVESIP